MRKPKILIVERLGSAADVVLSQRLGDRVRLLVEHDNEGMFESLDKHPNLDAVVIVGDEEKDVRLTAEIRRRAGAELLVVGVSENPQMQEALIRQGHADSAVTLMELPDKLSCYLFR